MIRIAALNESDSGEDEHEEQEGVTATREAKEAEAFSIYNHALGLQRANDKNGAEQLFASLLHHPFLKEAQDIVDSNKDDSHHPGLPLLYLVYKNLAAVAVARSSFVEGMQCYLKAVKIDASEVTVWYKMGILATKLNNYPLAKLAFEQGLQCNENHWPCLDNVITVLYALNDYWTCLDYISQALERDCHYSKGLAFHRQILKEQPSLSSETKEMFACCDPLIYSLQMDEAEVKKFIQEAVQIRDLRRELAKQPPPPSLKLSKPISQLTWKCVGECLIETYDSFVSSDPPKSLVLSLDLSEYEIVVGKRCSLADEPSANADKGKIIADAHMEEASEQIICKSPTHEERLNVCLGENITIPALLASPSTNNEACKTETMLALLPAEVIALPIPRSENVNTKQLVEPVGERLVETVSLLSEKQEAMDTSPSGAEGIQASVGKTDIISTGSSSLSRVISQIDKTATETLTRVNIIKSSDTIGQLQPDSDQMKVEKVKTSELKGIQGGEEKLPIEGLGEKQDTFTPGTLAEPTFSPSAASDVTLQIKTERCDAGLQKVLDGAAKTSHETADVESSLMAKSAISLPALPTSMVLTKAVNQVMSLIEISSDAGMSAAPATLSSSPIQSPNDAVTVKSEAERPLAGSELFKALSHGASAADPGQIIQHAPAAQVQSTALPLSVILPVDTTAKGTMQQTSGVTTSLLQSPPLPHQPPLMRSPTMVPSVTLSPVSSMNCDPAPASDLGGSYLSSASTQSPLLPNIPSPSSSAASTLQAHGSSSQPPTLPQFQFATITPREVQALLLDCLPPNPLLTTPSPSPYSHNMAERLRQVASKAAASTTSTATAQLQSLALLANMTNSMSSAGQVSGAGMVDNADQTSISTSLVSSSPPKRKSPVSQSTPVSAEAALHDQSGMGKNTKGARRGAKRKRSVIEELGGLHLLQEDYSIKRRSARVRNTRKEEDNVNFQKLLRNFLPSSLQRAQQEDEEMQTEDTTASVSQLQVDCDASGGNTGRPLVETEEEDVRTFLAECLSGQSAIGMMYKYLVYLSTRDACLWPTGVADLYLKVYNRMHNIFTFPSLESMNFPEAYYIEISRIVLVWCELTLDEFLVKKADSIVSPVAAQRSGDLGSTAVTPFTGENAKEDLYFLSVIADTTLLDMMAEFATHFKARVHWVKARQAMTESQMDQAISNLEMVAKCLCETEGGNKDVIVCLPNCLQDKIISLEEVKRQQESLQRYQSLEETQRLFETGNYAQVVEYLTPTFTQFQSQRHGAKAALPERHAQLELLQDALLQLQDWGRCLLWGEVAFNEALHHYRRAPTIAVRDNWALTLVRLLQDLQKVFDKDIQAINSLPSHKVVQLVQNLMKVIEINHDVSEAVTEMPIASVLPWILLYRIIHHEEDKLKSLQLPESGNQEKMEGAIRSSLMLLNIAHEYLGRHAWCTRDNGTFLVFFMDVLAAELVNANEAVKDDLETAFEQCVFCLYGHPNKKAKARHLFDHNAPPVELTWDKCEVIFDYFKPKALPEFDSYKTSTVSAELHNLLKRIHSLVPEESDPGKLVDQIQEYIEGDRNSAPTFTTSSTVLQELYYLLADYFFKNKEPAKAIKFYTYDVCFNSSRLDSWAGLALAKMSQLEQKLSSMELKIDAPLHKKSIAALRCFSRAVELCEGIRKLWIEYGSLAYQLHSHASRQLHMQAWFPLTPDLLEIATETRNEMLAIARNCYWKASECEAESSEEEWLHHYMMGKVQEKKHAHPREYLEHFKQAAIYLHEEGAKYPRKILYQHSPPHLSLEALEMYYRLHVAVMKHLLKTHTPETKENMMVFDRYVTEAKESPFALRQEKRKEGRDTLSSAEDSQSSATSIPPYSTTFQRPVYHMTPQDHNYSKQKSYSGGSSDNLSASKMAMETETSESAEEPETLTPSKSRNLSVERADEQPGRGPAASAGSVGVGCGKVSGTHIEGSVCVPTLSSVAVHRKSLADGIKKDAEVDGSSCMEVVELHNEQGCEVTGDIVDTRPLFLDKQVSEGFIPSQEADIVTFGRGKKSQDECVSMTDLTRTSIAAGSSTLGCALVDSVIAVSSVLENENVKELPQEIHGQERNKTDLSLPFSSQKCSVVASSARGEALQKQATDKPSTSVDAGESEALLQEVADTNHIGNSQISSPTLKEADPSEKSASASCWAVPVSDTYRTDHGLKDSNTVQDFMASDSLSSSSVILLSDPEESQQHCTTPGKQTVTMSARPNKQLHVADPSRLMPQLPEGHSEAVLEQNLNLFPSEPMEIAVSSQDLGNNLFKESRDGRRSGEKIAPIDGSGEKIAPIDGSGEKIAPIDGSGEKIAPIDGSGEKIAPIGGSGEKIAPIGGSEEMGMMGNDSIAPNDAVTKGTVLSTQDPQVISPKNPQVMLSLKETTPSSGQQLDTDIASKGKTTDSNKGREIHASQEALIDGKDEQLCEPPLRNLGLTDAKQVSDAEDKPLQNKLSPGTVLTGAASPQQGSSCMPGNSAGSKAQADSHKQETILSQEEFEKWKKELLDKCVAALHLCLSRFPTHYKSIYRLAHLYYMSLTHKNTAFARDLLLGNPEWQNLSHMPAQGLFAERRVNNFFQGIWKIPIEEIDRSGSFASHISRSVQLLLDVLRDLGEVRMLLLISTQLRKKPDIGRRYLRDGERQVLAKLAQSYMLDSVAMQLKRPEEEIDKKEVLLSAFCVYNTHRHGSNALQAMRLLTAAFRQVALPQQGSMSEVEQAIHYCTALIARESQAMTPRQERSRVSLNFTSPAVSTPVIPGINPAAFAGGSSLPNLPSGPEASVRMSGSSMQHRGLVSLPSGPTSSRSSLGGSCGPQSFSQISAHWESPSALFGVFAGNTSTSGVPLTPPRRVSTGTGTTDIIDLTSPEKQSPMRAAKSPQASVTTSTILHPRTPGAWPLVPPSLCPSHLHSSSPFSSPINPMSSGASAGQTPGYTTTDDPSDFDMSDPGDDLAFTSPDKLTSDVRHHFQGDLL